MSNIKKAGNFACITLLAASTALAGPLAAMAQDTPPPPPIEETPQPQPDAPPPVEVPEAPPAPDVMPEPAMPPVEELPQPEAPATPEPEPAPAPEPMPAPMPAPEPVQPPDEGPDTPPAPEEAPLPDASVPPASESRPDPDAPVGDPAELPVDQGTASDIPAAEPRSEPQPPAETLSPPPADPAPQPAPPPLEAPTPMPAPDVAPPPAPDAPTPEPAPIAPPPPAAEPAPVDAEIQTAPVPVGEVSASDARVQRLAEPADIRPIMEQTGERMEAAPRPVLPPDVTISERSGNRDILAITGAALAGAAAGAAATYFIRPDDRERLQRDSSDYYVEQLPRGMTRETVVRDNGVQIVTISNEYGDVIQRSRIGRDGNETVLFYDPHAEDDSYAGYAHDAGADLPPVRLQIPRDQYVVDIAEPDERIYYNTIVAPPVETVERIYSVNEVRRSQRIRDKVRRIDLATINFASGSATIEQAEIRNLQALADAIAQVLDENPDETFLLEGHTDAVGSEIANLALSDQRAESVAIALTEYFDIPAENLVTQGYGEQYLKIDTQQASRENRRVTLRRITPLVKPVLSSQR